MFPFHIILSKENLVARKEHGGYGTANINNIKKLYSLVKKKKNNPNPPAFHHTSCSFLARHWKMSFMSKNNLKKKHNCGDQTPTWEVKFENLWLAWIQQKCEWVEQARSAQSFSLVMAVHSLPTALPQPSRTARRACSKWRVKKFTSSKAPSALFP